jgi:hypothetical protein
MGILINVKDKYLIADPTACDSSDRTIDLTFEDLATNKELLNILNLDSMYADEEDAMTPFAHYISAFTLQLTPRYLLTDPTLRLLVLDEELRKEVRTNLGFSNE